MKRRRRNPTERLVPADFIEDYTVTYVHQTRVHVLTWTEERTPRWFEVSLAPFGRREHVGFTADAGFIVTARLRRGRVEFSDAALRKVGVRGRVVFEQMWPRLLGRMARR